MELKKTYIRTDRNGTRYYEVTTPCDKCGGARIIDCYKHVEGGRCFACQGSGVRVRTVKEYTEAYAAKLEARREAKEAAIAAEQEAKRKAWNPLDELAKMGLGEKVGIVVYAKTGKPVERYKEGSNWLYFDAKCQNIWNMYITSPDNETVLGNGMFQIVPMDWTDVFIPNKKLMELEWDENLADTFKNKYVYDRPQVPESQEVGKEGERIHVAARLVGIDERDTFFGPKYLYKFVDSGFNVMYWDTAKDLELAEGTRVDLTATVRDHGADCDGYYTNLARCVVAQAV